MASSSEAAVGGASAPLQKVISRWKSEAKVMEMMSKLDTFLESPSDPDGFSEEKIEYIFSIS